MKRTLIIALSLFLPLTMIAQKSPSSVTIMSYNIHHGTTNEGTNSWQMRYPASGMMIDDQKPDIICLQEAIPDHISYFDQVLKGYSHIGVGEEDGKKKGESTAILYKSKDYSIVKWGYFWLSETPDKPSKSWNSNETDCATWAIVKDKKNGNRFFLANIQLCEDDSEAQKSSAALVVSMLDNLNKDKLPVVIAGDFRMESNSEILSPISSLFKDARKTAAVSDSNHSFHAWGRKKETVDHIWYNGFSSCVEFSTITKAYYERTFISTHFPIKAKLVF